MRRALLLVVVAVLSAGPHFAGAQAATPTTPTPPTQPATGPGGSDYAYDRVVFSEHGEEAGGYLLFEPADPHGGGTPVAPAPVPVVLFFSACCEGDDLNDIADNGAPWLDWIEHLVRRGAVVVFPLWNPLDPMTGVITAVRSALAELEGSGHPPTDPAQLVAVGHSFGAMLAVQYAASAADEGLPVPIALLSIAPGWGELPCALENTRAVPSTTRLLVLVADNDYQAIALEIWARLDQIPADRRDFLVVHSDRHGSPPLIADHGIPATDVFGTLDALDWYGIWKWADALIACSIDGAWCEYALGNTPEQRFLGTWSDGTPVQEPLVTDDPRIGTP
jgi:pimeloyl-ACP methyl ester carboxylesterase